MAGVVVVYVHVLVVGFEATVSKSGRFDVCPWHKVFCSVWVLLFANVTWYWMSSSDKSADPLRTFESTFIHASVLLLTCDLLSSISWTGTLKIIVRFLKKTILALFVLWRVKSVDIWWQTLHWCWIYTFGHSVHVTCFLFYGEWRRKLIVIYCVIFLIIFIWFQVSFVLRCWSYRNSILIVNI